MTDDPQISPRLTLRKDGSILVEGPIEVYGHEGQRLETKPKFSLCRCGASKNKPFCDGSHKEIGFCSEPC